MTVSIIMPTYNCEKYIGKAIDSVIQQTYTDWELYIIDDCSTDQTISIVEKYKQDYPNIYFIKLNTNSGPDVARTTGIKCAKGKYIAFLDSDDLWKPDKLKKQIRFMEIGRASCRERV